MTPRVKVWANRHREKRRDMLSALKRMRGCQDCGYDAHGEALDFDHVRGEKKFTIGAGGGLKPLLQLWAEIAKCDVVCANCHRVRTRKGRRKL